MGPSTAMSRRQFPKRIKKTRTFLGRTSSILLYTIQTVRMPGFHAIVRRTLVTAAGVLPEAVRGVDHETKISFRRWHGRGWAQWRGEMDATEAGIGICDVGAWARRS